MLNFFPVVRKSRKVTFKLFFLASSHPSSVCCKASKIKVNTTGASDANMPLHPLLVFILKIKISKLFLPHTHNTVRTPRDCCGWRQSTRTRRCSPRRRCPLRLEAKWNFRNHYNPPVVHRCHLWVDNNNTDLRRLLLCAREFKCWALYCL